MKKYKAAAVLMIIHGGLIEIGGCIALLFTLACGKTVDMDSYFTFIVPYLRENLSLMLVMGAIYGAMRVIGAVGLLKRRMWGLVLSVINCVVTMALMIFMLPAGIVDGLLSCTALVLMLTAYLGKTKIA